MSDQPLILTEWEERSNVHLDHVQRLALQTACPWIQLRQESGTDMFTVRSASNKVGVINVDDLQVMIRPAKCSADLVVFMMAYTKNPTGFSPDSSPLADDANLWEAMLRAFAHQLKSALRFGVHRGYLEIEEALPTVRGRIRFGDQIRVTQRLAPPLQVTYDEYTEDVLENRLLKAALLEAHRFPIRSEGLRRVLRQSEPLLANVTAVSFEPRNIPTPTWTRLNRHLQHAVELATLILQHMSIALNVGATSSPSFVVDMADVFENFVVAGLRDALELTEREFQQTSRALSLAENVALEPDYSWWKGGRCIAIGDVKYKRVNVEGVVHANLYQVFSYATAANLPNATLIYAQGEADRVSHHVTMADKRLDVEVLDLNGGPELALEELRQVAERIRAKAQSQAVAAA